MMRDVSVREVMNADFVGISESDGLTESVDLLLSENATVAVVVRGSDVVGALTESNALAAFLNADDPETVTVGTAMTADVPTIHPDRGLHQVRDRMATLGRGWLIVSEGDRPLGVVTDHDLLAASTLDPEGSEDEREAEPTVVSPGATAAGTDSPSATEDAFEEQGICEVCGALTADLVAFNGQLRCADCRDV